MKHIVTLLVKELKKRCKEQLDIELTVRDSAKSFIVDKAYDRKYGARPLKRKLQEEIEDRMSEDIITGKIKRGNKVIISPKLSFPFSSVRINSLITAIFILP